MSVRGRESRNAHYPLLTWHYVLIRLFPYRTASPTKYTHHENKACSSQLCPYHLENWLTQWQSVNMKQLSEKGSLSADRPFRGQKCARVY